MYRAEVGVYVFLLIQLVWYCYGFSVSVVEMEWVWSLCPGRHKCSAHACTCVPYCEISCTERKWECMCFH